MRVVRAMLARNHARVRRRARSRSVQPAMISHRPIASPHANGPACTLNTINANTPMMGRAARRTCQRLIQYNRRVATITTTHATAATPTGSTLNPVNGQNTATAPATNRPGTRRASSHATRIW
jgi:hypothetical protein